MKSLVSTLMLLSLAAACGKDSKPAASAAGVERFASDGLCIQDAVECSDGTWVGRSGPQCEFQCPQGAYHCPQDKLTCPDGVTVVGRALPDCLFTCP